MNPFILWLLSVITVALAAPAATKNVTLPRRERNLDHLNVESMAYYLGLHPTTLKPLDEADYVGYDVAVMFYAQWDKNSHTLAPYWDKIAATLRAGSKDSKLIMGLFDCERDYQHVLLCDAAGIKKYPIMLFIGAGPFYDTDPITRIIGKDRSAGPAGAAKLPRTVKFQGNWLYTDSLKDWIRAMQGLSAWNQLTRQGVFKILRSRGILGLFFHPSRKQDASSNSLPVGIPQVTGGGGAAAAAGSVQKALLEKKLEGAEKEAKHMEKTATHASLLLDNVLFPPTNKDPFVNLVSADGWNKNNTDVVIQVMRACVTELSLDYCSRLSTRITSEYIDQALLGGANELTNIGDIESELKKKLSAQEAYCGIFDECHSKNFAPEECRPSTCPFKETGCNYLSACFDSLIQKEYAIALGLIKDGDSFPPLKKPKGEAVSESKKKSGKWGFF